MVFYFYNIKYSPKKVVVYFSFSNWVISFDKPEMEIYSDIIRILSEFFWHEWGFQI